MSDHSPIKFKEKFSYALGDINGNTCYMIISSYLLYFYTDVAGIAVGTIGILMAIVRTIDSIANPLIGFAVDRTESKFGKIRPWLLYTNLPLTILMVALFCAPNLSVTMKAVYAFVTFLLYSIIYSMSNTPYSSLSTNMTDREDERLQLSKYRTLAMSLSSFAVTFTALPLVTMLGRGDEKKGFFWMILLFAGICFVSMQVCFQNTRERIRPKKEENPLPLWTAIRYACKSTPWLLLCLLQSLSMSAFTIRSENMVYFCKYILNNRDFVAVLQPVSSIITFVVAFFLPKLAEKLGKRNILFYGCLIHLVSLLGIALVGDSAAGVFVFYFLSALGNSCSTGLFFVMISETVDHSEWQCGVRQQGLLGSLLMLVVKLFSMIVSLISSRILSFAGYVENMEPTAQVITAIKTNFIYLPMVLAVLFLITCRFYRLEEQYPTILKELHERREAQAENNA